MRYTELAERSKSNQYHPRPNSEGAGRQKQAFHHSRTSLGAAGHLLHMGMVAAPLIIGELIVDTDKKWRAMRLVPVIGAIASEGIWTYRLAQDRRRDEEAHAALRDCEQNCMART